MSPHRLNTSSPSGALAVGRIRTEPSPVARARSHRSTSAAQGSNSPDPRSANRLTPSSLYRQHEELGLSALAEDVLAERPHHALHLADVGLDRSELQVQDL